MRAPRPLGNFLLVLAQNAYATDLFDEEWQILKALVLEAGPGGSRPHAHQTRELLNAILSRVRSRCVRQFLPRDSPPWERARWTDHKR
jgi:transposase